MSLRITVIKCVDLPNFELIGLIDPYVVLTFRGLEKTTTVKDDILNPEWNEQFEWTLQSSLNPTETVKIEVYDEERVGKNRLVGHIDYSVNQLWGTKEKKEALKLIPSKKAKKVKNADKATIHLEFVHTSLSQQVAQKNATSGPVQAVGQGDSAGGGTEADVFDTATDHDRGGSVSGNAFYEGQTEAGASTITGTSKKRVRHPKLPDKPLDFQVRIHVLEGRKLEGNNISPIVKVSCGNEFHKTSSRKGTNSPVFDETIIFNLKERPVEMFDKKIELKVLDSGKKIRESIVGLFLIDVGTVYYEPKHCFLHKWLLLTNPDEAADGPKGFLKVTMSILGPDDDPIESSSDISPDDVDIESNLLRPSGVRLQSATIEIKVYGAEDLPQMDPEYFQKIKSFLSIGNGPKELVDPFAVVSFAGHTDETAVKWNTQRPDWNEQINIGFRFPSICERIRIQLKDKDKFNSDDYIGTCFINLPEISAQGDQGYLPTFGPCYVNVYGSPREFTDLPDKYENLNKGLLDGVAYRGRVLLELETKLGSLPDEKKEHIPLSEQRKLQTFKRRRKYVLFAVFHAATMLQLGKDSVEFEVSIGNYGNKLEKNTLAQSSSTQSRSPIYDGRAYHYIPWKRSKPCIVVESYWEDCSYRMACLNLLNNLADKLEHDIDEIKRLLRLPTKFQELVPNRVQDVCFELLDSLTSCACTMPQLPPEGYTKLDKLLRGYRILEITSLCSIVDGIAANLNMPTDKKLEELTGILDRIRSVSVDSQNSVPDIIISMLVKGKRVASKRIPSHLLMFSETSGISGSKCGKLINLKLDPPATFKEKDLDGNRYSVMLQTLLWLGFDEDREKWSSHAHSPGGELTTYAETYENQAFYGVWGSGRKLARPNWSNSNGKIKLAKEYFDPPPKGWGWEGDWFIDPEQGDEPDTVDIVTVDVYEVQIREKFDAWPGSPEDSTWADTSGFVLTNYKDDGQEYSMTIDDIDKETPAGWEWIGRWQVDVSGPVSCDGWEYSTSRYDNDEGFSEEVDFIAYERNEHLTRRRKWIRTRQRIADDKTIRTNTEGWQYAAHPSASYHSVKQRLDFFRRRRWHRKLCCTEPGHPAVFYISPKSKKDKKNSRKLSSVSSDEIQMDCDGGYQLTPHMYVMFQSNECTMYQLRAYLYQARDLYGADSTGLSDPYAIVSCGNCSQISRIVAATLSPLWNEALILDRIKIYGNPEAVIHSPPVVAVELYDKDTIGQNEYLGLVTLKPTVRMVRNSDEPVLEWLKIERYGKAAGEMLAAFELIRVGNGGWEPEKLIQNADGYWSIPPKYTPELKKMRIEILCWGVRDMKRHNLLAVNHPFVEIECSGEIKKTEPVVNEKKNPMFPNPILIMDVDLPIEEVYSPPLNIRVFDQRKFGHTPMVGTCHIKSLKSYEESKLTKGVSALQRAMTLKNPRLRTSSKSDCDDLRPMDVSINIDEIQMDEFIEDDLKYDWWSKYYASIEGESNRVQDGYIDENHDSFVIYNGELEKEFNNFTDLAYTFPLFRGKGQQSDESENAVGYFKGAIKVYSIDDEAPMEAPKFSASLPIKWPQEVIVRVYVIRGFDLQPRDIGGSSDPYIKVSVGKKEISDKENFITSDLNPVFGAVYELDAVLPFDRTLTVTVMDHDYLTADDVIGSTTIDLENRFLSLHRPLCGLSETFSKIGPNRWRDYMSPVDILNNLARFHGISAPVWDGNKVTYDNMEYTLGDFEDNSVLHPYVGAELQRLALHVLRQKQLVPEHIEKRTLYNPVTPGIPQGQIHMWVDMFPKLPGMVEPCKVDITPRRGEKYCLRIVIWNTSDVILDERSVATGDSMSDIYVKGWLSEDDVQKTDVHYRSMDGDGMFNWRFVFPFEYLRQEKKMIVKKKEHFYSLDKIERHLPVRLNLQVWDNDLISADDFLGKIDFDLHKMPLPAKTKRRCRLNLLDERRNHKFVDLFEQKHVKGWLPVYQENVDGERHERTLAGKLEVEFDILTEEEEKARPAGKARDDPNQNPKLEKPNRPELSFAWFASPLKTFKFIIWRHHKGKIIFGTILLFIIISILLLF